MNVNRNLPTLSGQQNAQFDSVRATALAVTGTTSMGGPLEASSLIGGCITDSLTFSSSSVAASAAGLSNVAARVDLTKGGGIVGNLSVSGDVTCTGKYHGDGSALTGISGGGGGGGNATAPVSGINIVNTINTNSSLVISATNTNTTTGAIFQMPPGSIGVQVNDPGSPFDGVGSNASMTSAILADSEGNLVILGANNLLLWPLASPDEAFGCYGTRIYDPYLYGWTRIRVPNPAGGALDAMIFTQSGLYAIITATNSIVTFKKIWFTTTCTIVSDASLKTNVVSMPSAISLLEQLKPVSFNWTSNALHNEADQAATNYGFIAQEVQAVKPELVEKMENGLLGVNITSLIPFLVKGIQELSMRVKALESAGSNI